MKLHHWVVVVLVVVAVYYAGTKGLLNRFTSMIPGAGA